MQVALLFLLLWCTSALNLDHQFLLMMTEKLYKDLLDAVVKQKETCLDSDSFDVPRNMRETMIDISLVMKNSMTEMIEVLDTHIECEKSHLRVVDFFPDL